ncbi:hypothetical protein [Psychrobacter sp. AT9]|uniref:hypothetical protein n=1 Tax=Psychrobacter sp. AT9 TaxID=3242893 RepID=UPI0039A614CF
MSHPNTQDILQSPRAQKEFERLSSALNERNQQLHNTEQQLTQSKQHLKTKVRGYRQVLSIVVLALFVLIAILVMGGAA